MKITDIPDDYLIIRENDKKNLLALPKTMQIFIKGFPKTHTIDVERNYTILKIKYILYRRHIISNFIEATLTWCGRVLYDSYTLIDHGICKENTLHLRVRLRNGPGNGAIDISSFVRTTNKHDPIICNIERWLMKDYMKIEQIYIKNFEGMNIIVEQAVDIGHDIVFRKLDGTLKYKNQSIEWYPSSITYEHGDYLRLRYINDNIDKNMMTYPISYTIIVTQPKVIKCKYNSKCFDVSYQEDVVEYSDIEQQIQSATGLKDFKIMLYDIICLKNNEDLQYLNEGTILKIISG